MARPAAIAERLGLLQPIYANTAAYGHFGRPEFPWEQRDRVAQLRTASRQRSTNFLRGRR